MTDLVVRLDIETCDPDILGEALRSLTFTGKGFGCYSTFDLREDAAPLGGEWAKQIMQYEDGWWGTTRSEDFSGYSFRHEGIMVECYWMWDGDGHLMYRLSDKGHRFLRAVENTDCKKDYGWKDVQLAVAKNSNGLAMRPVTEMRTPGRGRVSMYQAAIEQLSKKPGQAFLVRSLASAGAAASARSALLKAAQAAGVQVDARVSGVDLYAVAKAGRGKK
jgi:hypothetical protein